MFGRIVPYKFLHLLVFQQLDIFYSMADNKPVLTDHNRKHHVFMLCNPVCLDEIIISLLVIFRIYLDPAGIPCPHAVGVLAVDIQRTGQRPVHKRKRDRQPVGRRHIEHFPHQGQSCGRSCRHRPCPRRLRADCRAHRTVLAFYRNKFRIHLSVCYVRSYKLRQLR